MSTEQHPKLRRALDYPYPLARWSDYLFDHGEVRELPDAYDYSGRVPVLAVGSNRSPEQLTRKYRDTAQIPVTRFEMTGYDVAYCAYMTHYGSMPATLVDAPGTRVTLAITWLTRDQLARMHDTESVGPHTQFGWLRDHDGELPVVASDTLPRRAPPAVLTYVSARGLLTHGHQRILLTDVLASGRPAQDEQSSIAVLSQQQVLTMTWQYARRHSGADLNQDFEQWLLGQIDNPPRREHLNDLLQNSAASSLPRRFEPVHDIASLSY